MGTDTQQQRPMRVVSLFAGCGGMDLGFEAARLPDGRPAFHVVWANERDTRAHATYRRNFPAATLDPRPIGEVGAESIPACDGVIGGPPCQPFSSNGSRRGTDDPRGQMAFEFVRVVRAKRPRFFVLENVPALAQARYRGAFDRIVADFRELGYRVRADVLCAADHGVAQTRKRLFVVGVRADLPGAYVPPSPVPVSRRPTLRDAVGDLEASAVASDAWASADPPVNAHEHVPVGCVRLSRWFMSNQRLRGWDEPSYTIPASVTSLPFHPSAPKLVRDRAREAKGDRPLFVRVPPVSAYRKFTARECARIQGFPDSYVFLYDRMTAVHRMIGNAVPPPLATAVATAVAEAVGTTTS